jgi:hypothetical protein
MNLEILVKPTRTKDLKGYLNKPAAIDTGEKGNGKSAARTISIAPHLLICVI